MLTQILLFTKSREESSHKSFPDSFIFFFFFLHYLQALSPTKKSHSKRSTIKRLIIRVFLTLSYIKLWSSLANFFFHLQLDSYTANFVPLSRGYCSGFDTKVTKSLLTLVEYESHAEHPEGFELATF